MVKLSSLALAAVLCGSTPATPAPTSSPIISETGCLHATIAPLGSPYDTHLNAAGVITVCYEPTSPTNPATMKVDVQGMQESSHHYARIHEGTDCTTATLATISPNGGAFFSDNNGDAVIEDAWPAWNAPHTSRGWAEGRAVVIRSGVDNIACGLLLPPTNPPSSYPSENPTDKPSAIPSEIPSEIPTGHPTHNPSNNPSGNPTDNPSGNPSEIPTGHPTHNPSNNPSGNPTDNPSGNPSEIPSEIPTGNPTTSHRPSTNPSAAPTTSPSNSPSENPSRNPSENPTGNPSDSPSTSPTSSPIPGPSQAVVVTGSISINMGNQQGGRRFLASSNSSGSMQRRRVTGADNDNAILCNSIPPIIADKFDCNASNSCTVAITSCAEVSGTMQIDFELTRTFACDQTDCASAQDTAASSDWVDSSKESLTNSLNDGSLLQTIIAELVAQDDSIDVSCFSVWGIVQAPEYSDSTTGNTGVYYPDWENSSGTCVADGNEPLYMKLNGAQWLSNSLVECCDKYFSGWNKNECLNFEGSGLWFANYETDKCMTDCKEGNGETCGGVANLPDGELFTSPRECCESKFPWLLLSACESESLPGSCYEGTGLYYRGDVVGKAVCVRDCNPTNDDDTCGGLVEHSYVVLHDSPTDCCAAEYGWMETELCAARSTGTPSDNYWPDQTKSKCFKDSETPADDLGVTLFATLAECCEKGIWWMSESACAVASGGVASSGGTGSSGTEQFFVKWGSSGDGCVKNTGSNLAQNWNQLHDTEDECCAAIPWIPRQDCVL